MCRDQHVCIDIKHATGLCKCKTGLSQAENAQFSNHPFHIDDCCSVACAVMCMCFVPVLMPF